MFIDINKSYKKSYDALVKKNITFPKPKYFKKATTANNPPPQDQKTAMGGADSKATAGGTNRPSDTRPQPQKPEQTGKSSGSHPMIAKTGKIIAVIVRLSNICVWL